MLVEVRVVGRIGAGLEPRVIDGPAAEAVSLRGLIGHCVRAEVAAFESRERQRRFVRVLSPDEIAAGAAAGKVDSGGRPRTGPVDVEEAVATALQAFEDGLFVVMVDDQQVEALDDAVALTPQTRVRFVRLTALAGG